MNNNNEIIIRIILEKGEVITTNPITQHPIQYNNIQYHEIDLTPRRTKKPGLKKGTKTRYHKINLISTTLKSDKVVKQEPLLDFH